MNIETRQVADLVQDPVNARVHDGRNLEAIKASLRAFGQQKPIVVNQAGRVVAGNGTLAAADDLGWTDIQAVTTTLEEAQQAGYAIADNRTSELSAWDNEALVETIGALGDNGFDLGALGFSEGELSRLIGSLDDLNIDGTATAGHHRGFTTSAEDYEKSAIRTMVMHFGQEQYKLVVAAFNKEAKERGVDTFSEVLLGLLGDAGHAL